MVALLALGGVGSLRPPGIRGTLRSVLEFQAEQIKAYAGALTKWMRLRFPDRPGLEISDIDIPTTTGFSNETVMFDATWQDRGEGCRRRYVARVEPADGGMFPAQSEHCGVSVQVQYQVMSHVDAAGLSAVPIPPLVGYEPNSEVLGRPFFVMEFVEGVIPADRPRYTEAGFLVDDASPAERRRLALTGVEIMAAVHSLDWRSDDLVWLRPAGSGKPTTAVQLDLYRRLVVDELAGRDHPVLFAAFDWLTANDPGDERFGLTWGDARVGNVIWQDYRPAAVLDWEECALSPTEADVGWWLMFDRMSHEDVGVERLEGYPTRAEMIEHYEKVSGREVREPHYWEVFGAMRFCAIFIRLVDRMIAAGVVPESLNYSVANMVTASLANLLGIHNPTPDALQENPTPAGLKQE